MPKVDKMTGEVVSSPSVFRSRSTPRLRVGIDLSHGGRTHQSFKDECDINVLMKRYQVSGVLPYMQQREARFADVSALDFQEAMLTVAEAKSAFAGLSAELRARFDNDPAKLLGFLDEEGNRDEAVKLGLVKPKEPEGAPVKVELSEASAALLRAASEPVKA